MLESEIAQSGNQSSSLKNFMPLWGMNIILGTLRCVDDSIHYILGMESGRIIENWMLNSNVTHCAFGINNEGLSMIFLKVVCYN